MLQTAVTDEQEREATDVAADPDAGSFGQPLTAGQLRSLRGASAHILARRHPGTDWTPAGVVGDLAA
jgi:hypothetical protein